MASTNKDGQTMGRKGAETRARLLVAGRDLLGSVPVHRLTASAIARAAGLASQSFYLYFRDVDELLLLLCAEAAEDMGGIHAELDIDWPADALEERAERFVAAFYAYWDRNRPVLSLRNFLADTGHERFDAERNSASLPVVHRLARHIREAHGEGLAEKDAFARAVIIFAAIERMAARYSVIETESGRFGAADLKRAEVHILSLLLARP